MKYVKNGCVYEITERVKRLLDSYDELYEVAKIIGNPSSITNQDMRARMTVLALIDLKEEMAKRKIEYVFSDDPINEAMSKVYKS